jgi:hypothetical protein
LDPRRDFNAPAVDPIPRIPARRGVGGGCVVFGIVNGVKLPARGERGYVPPGCVRGEAGSATL